jgi:membrane protein DedA with SNARE-associated domain
VLALFTTFITDTLRQHGYLAVFVLMTLESACIPIPSEVTMLLGGALTVAAVAAVGHVLNLPLVIVAGVGGNLVGSLLAYWAGAYGGRPFVDRFGRYLLIRPHEVDRAQAWFERRGPAAVFVGRLLPVVRTFISLPAGVAKMPLRRFVLYTALGCVPWVAALAVAGAAAGSQWEKVSTYIRPVGYLLAAAIIVLGVIFIAKRWKIVRLEYAALDRAKEPEQVKR